MFLIYCPHCQEHREEDEFHASGEAHLARPLDPDSCTDEEWGDYLYMRRNPRGLHRELWVHAAGCRKYFNIARDSQTYQIYGSYKVGEHLTVDETAVPPGQAQSSASSAHQISDSADHTGTHTRG